VVQAFHVYRVLAECSDSESDSLMLLDAAEGDRDNLTKELWIVQEWCDLGDLTASTVLSTPPPPQELPLLWRMQSRPALLLLPVKRS
jgi:hypothetical protein